MTKEQKDLEKKVKWILERVDILKDSVVETLDGFEAEDADTYSGMFDALYKQIEELKK